MHAAARLFAVSTALLAAAALPAAATAAPATTAAAKPTATSSGKAALRLMPADWRKRYAVTSAAADPDRDGLTNLTEFRARTNPRRADTDGDRLRDDREDADRDGLTNLMEQRTANDPRDRDSDDDGVRDGAEGAGQIVAFDEDTFTLTLRLAATGRTVRGVLDCGQLDDESADDDSLDDGTDDDVVEEDGDDPDAEDAPDDETDDEVDLTAASVRSIAGADACELDRVPVGAWVTESELDRESDPVLFVSVTLAGR